MEKYLLGVDNGGTFIKAALFDAKGNQIGIAKHYNNVLNPGPGRSEFNQDELWETNCTVMREVIKSTGIDPKQIVCIGFAGQGKGLYAVDSQGKSFRNAITSSDSRAKCYAEICKRDGTDERLFNRIYQFASGGKPHAILKWIKDNEPENYKKIHWVFSMKDYLVFRLTGNAIGGMGAFSGTNLVNLNTQTYDPELFEAYGIADSFSKMPPLYWDTQPAGTVTKEAALQCGCAAGTPVSAGMFDVDASAIAMGVVNSKPVFIITGTHGINGYITPKPVTNGTVKLNSLYSLPGMYLIEEGYPSSSGTLEWVLDQLFDREAEEVSSLYAKVNGMVAGIEPDQSNLVYLPFLSGWRDAKNAAACYIGMRPEHTKAHMVRAVYEGVVFSHMLQIEHLFMNRERPEKILMAGGATNSQVWVQMFADALQIPIQIVRNEEMGAKGVAMVSSVAAGMYPTIDDAVEAMRHEGSLIMPRVGYKDVYARKFETFKILVNTLCDVWALL